MKPKSPHPEKGLALAQDSTACATRAEPDLLSKAARSFFYLPEAHEELDAIRLRLFGHCDDVRPHPPAPSALNELLSGIDSDSAGLVVALRDLKIAIGEGQDKEPEEPVRRR